MRLSTLMGLRPILAVVVRANGPHRVGAHRLPDWPDRPRDAQQVNPVRVLRLAWLRFRMDQMHRLRVVETVETVDTDVPVGVLLSTSNSLMAPFNMPIADHEPDRVLSSNAVHKQWADPHRSPHDREGS